MKNICDWLMSVFMLASLPLIAEDAPANEEREPLQETAQFGNRRTTLLGAKNTDKEPQSEVVTAPEEQKIELHCNVITPSVYPYISHGTNTYATLDFIWWKTVIGGTGYAYTGSADGYNVPLGVSVHSGTLKRPDFGFQPGFKVGLGTNFEHDAWDIYAEYTHLAGPEEENKISASEGNGGKTRINITTGDGVVAPISFDKARSEWKQDFNVIDLELGRNFFLSKHLIMRPFVGLKTAWIHEVLKYSFAPTPNTYDPRESGGIPQNEILAVYSRRQQHMWGLGLRGGIDTMWHITKNWAFYGDLALTTLWADFHIKATDKPIESIKYQYETLDIHYSVQTVIPVIETGLGLAYITWFCSNDYRFQFQAGWEQQIWTDINYFQQQGSGSLSTQGLTMKAGLTF